MSKKNIIQGLLAEYLRFALQHATLHDQVEETPTTQLKLEKLEKKRKKVRAAQSAANLLSRLPLAELREALNKCRRRLNVCNSGGRSRSNEYHLLLAEQAVLESSLKRAEQTATEQKAANVSHFSRSNEPLNRQFMATSVKKRIAV